MGNHEYELFEQEMQRWDAAEQLVRNLGTRIQTDRDAWIDRWHPTDPQLDEFIDAWLSSDVVVCQDKRSGNCPGPESCGRRCTVGYWRVHGDDVAHNMAALARELGENERLWWIVGRIHDVDYAMYPHHEPEVSSETAHPMALATQLVILGAPPAVVLAILTHAPHLRLYPASPLAWALLACDEHATMTSFAKADSKLEPRYPEHLQKLASVLRPATSTIRGGYYRKDMQGRANLGLQKLFDYRRGVVPKFDYQAFDRRIDWDAEIERQ